MKRLIEFLCLVGSIPWMWVAGIGWVIIAAFLAGSFLCSCSTIPGEYAEVWTLDRLNGFGRDWKVVIWHSTSGDIVMSIPKSWQQNPDGSWGPQGPQY
jgi:hypothetical protein